MWPPTVTIFIRSATDELFTYAQSGGDGPHWFPATGGVGIPQQIYTVDPEAAVISEDGRVWQASPL